MKGRTTVWHVLGCVIVVFGSSMATAEPCTGPETVCAPLAQIAAPPSILPTAQGMTPRDKVSTMLRHALSEREAGGRGDLSAETTSSGLSLSTSGVLVSPAAEVHVYIELTEFRQEYVARLEGGYGLRVEVTLPQFRLIQGWVPISAVDGIAALDFVKEVRQPDYGVRNSTGAAATAGDSVLRAAMTRQVLGVSGAGVKVGVISDGVGSLAASQTSGDLPFVEVLAAGSGSEGTALLEIVHDLAPGAALAFYGPDTSAEMVQAINALRDVGARVVMDDIGWPGEPKFQDGMVAQTIDAFAQDGRLYVGAAGNNAQVHYRAVYKPATLNGVAWKAAHNFSANSTDIGNNISIAPGCTARIVLQWTNPFGGSGDDFDIIIARSTDGFVLFNTSDRQTGSQNPLEAISVTNNGTSAGVVAVVIGEFRRVSAPANLVLDYFVFGGCGGQEFVTSGQSLLGNNAAAGMLSVAAVNAATPTVAAAYSSRGPHQIFFPAFEERQVPNITATDCVATHTPGFTTFCGTSAAAPHVAAIAALVFEADPGLSTGRAREILMGTAIDLGAGGFDTTFGYGRVDAFNAVNTAMPVFVSIFSNGASFRPGQTVVVGVRASNPGGGAPLDLYVGSLWPDMNTIAFLAGPDAFGGLGQYSAPASVARMAVVASATSIYNEVLHYTFPATGIPIGTYKVFAALFRQGSLADNVLHDGDLVALDFFDLTYSP